MKKIILITSILLSVNYMFSQQNVGIGTSTPHSSALVDMSATNKGLLIPRVTLVAVNNATTPVNNPETGLLVFNSSGSLEQGFYYWNGTQWVLVGSGGSDECTTLDEAYNCGGAGAGRQINANAGAVEVYLPQASPDNIAFYVESNQGTNSSNPSAGIWATHNQFGVGVYSEITKTTNDYSAIQGVTNTSLTGDNIATGVSGYHDGTGIGAGIWGEAASNSSAGASYGVYGKGSNKSFGGYFFGQNYPGAFCETNSTSAVALQIAGAGQSPASPAFLSVGYAQFSSGNGTTQGGALLINNLAGEITIASDHGSYGYVGSSGTEWWGLYYYNAIQASRRELKRDITYFDENLNAYLMDNIMAMKPSFYKYKTENDEKIPGKENRTRYNMHMGFILDETPDFIQDNSFSGIDIYSLTTLGITGVQINRRDIDKINEELTEIFDFGTAQINGNEIYVSYNKNFNGAEPVVSITPMAAVKDYYIKSQTSTGFTIAVENANNFKFNWIAVATKSTKQNNSSIAIDTNLKSQLEVDPAKKQDIHNELFINEGPQKTIELQGKDASKYNAKKFTPKIER